MKNTSYINFVLLKTKALIIILAIAFISILFSCNKNAELSQIENTASSVPIKTAKLRTGAPYTTNQFTGDTISPIINSVGDTIKTGIAIPVSLTTINTKEFKEPLITSNNEEIKIPVNSSTYLTNELNSIPINEKGVYTFLIGKDTSSYRLKNSFGTKLITGKAIEVKGKVTRCILTNPVPALPLRMEKNAIGDIQYLSVEQGMSSSYLNTLLEDKDGNIWMGTSTGGLSRYDGKDFMHISQKEGLNSIDVKSLAYDQKGNIWIGTDNGLTSYNGKTFTTYTEENGFIDNGVRCLTVTKNGALWIGTDHGVAKYQNDKFTFYSKREGLKNNNIRAIFEDDKGNIWIGSDGAGVTVFDGKSMTTYTIESGLINGAIRSIQQDKKGIIWIGTKGNGPVLFNGKSFSYFSNSELVFNTDVRCMARDKEDNIWFGTRRDGVIKYDGKRFTQYNEAQGLSNSLVHAILCDKEGGVWAGTQGKGINRINPNSFNHYSQIATITHNIVNHIIGDKTGAIYFALDGNGILKLKDSTYYLYKGDKDIGTSIPYRLCLDNKGIIWFSTKYDGIMKFDGKNYTTYTRENGLPGTVASSVYIDSKENIWFGYENGNLAKFTNNEIKQLIIPDFKDHSIQDIDEDKLGNIWFNVTDIGIVKFDGKNITIYSEAEGLRSNNYKDLLITKNNDIWLCTDHDGVNKIENEKVILLNENNGLASNITWSLLEDKEGKILVGTEMGLSIIDEKNRARNDSYSPDITNYKRAEGLKDLDFYNQTAYLDNNNTAWWYAGSTATSLNLNHLKNKSSVPTLKLTQLDIDGNFYDYNNLSDSLKDELRFDSVAQFYNYPTKLKLPYNRNHLTFHFSGIEWKSGNKLKYQYKLEGADKKWSHITENNFADYRNITYGKYTFKVKTLGSSNKWSNIVEYNFEISAPWWQRWWFRIIVLLAIVTIIWYYIKGREKKLVAQKEKLEKTVLERTAEIVEQKHQIEEKHKEITDSINYAERIQRSFLATKEMLDANLKEYFVFFKPKDVVSGDFYWAANLSNGTFALLTADSTGHGVPGAIMSLLNITSVESAIKDGITEPEQILNATRNTIIERLKKDGSEEGGKDGMDATLTIYDFKNKKVKISAAHNPVWIVRGAEIVEIKADKMPVGKHDKQDVSFSQQEFIIQDGDVIYTLTDGYPDQFGGENGKKFMSKKLRELLASFAHLPMKEQHQQLESTFSNWIGNLEQIDDVTIIGVRV